jgi:hypothetical protein
LAVSASLASCGGDDKPATPACTHFNYATWMPGMNPVTLATNVMPILQANCAQANTCHTKGGMALPALGALGMVTITADEIKAALVGKPSTEVPSMNFVTATDPAQSYLMRKVEQANPGCELMCTSPASAPMGCSTQMPNGGMPLSPGDQDTIRTWIKQGAN